MVPASADRAAPHFSSPVLTLGWPAPAAHLVGIPPFPPQLFGFLAAALCTLDAASPGSSSLSSTFANSVGEKLCLVAEPNAAENLMLAHNSHCLFAIHSKLL